MRAKILRLGLLLGCLTWPGMAPPDAWAAEAMLAARLEAVTGRPEFRTAHWGLLVTDQATGAVLYERNADELFAPASTTKLFSVAAALDAMGAEHRFETTVYRQGEITADGELRGDLILLAGGDPTLGGRTVAAGKIAFHDVDHIYANGGACHELTAPDPLAGLNELARQVAASGIRRVTGEVAVDDRLFEKSPSSGSGPALVTPVMVNDNLVDFLVRPGSGPLATVDWRPQSAAVRVDAHVTLGAAGGKARIEITSPGPGRFVVRGEFPADGEPLVRVAEMEDSAAFARALFIEALARAGVGATASALGENPAAVLRPAGEKYPVDRRVARFTSPPFAEEAKLILKVSHNVHASELPLLLAVRHGQRTLAEGLHWEHEFLARAGVDVAAISFGGGAGGAASDFTTPRATVQLLRYMGTRPDFAVYEAALPRLGVDGTLAKVVATNSPARDHVRAKTGTLVRENTLNGNLLLTSKALAGYLTTAQSRRLIVALVVNNVPLAKDEEVAKVGATLGRLCEIIHEAP